MKKITFYLPALVLLPHLALALPLDEGIREFSGPSAVTDPTEEALIVCQGDDPLNDPSYVCDEGQAQMQMEEAEEQEQSDSQEEPDQAP